MNENLPLALPSLGDFEDVHDAMQHFLHCFPSQDVKEILYHSFCAFLLSHKFDGLDAHQRAHILLFFEQLPLFIEAGRRLQQQRIAKGAKMHYIIQESQTIEKQHLQP